MYTVRNEHVSIQTGTFYVYVHAEEKLLSQYMLLENVQTFGI